ncbi:hypothetical protein [Psychrobacter submarinus]|uniref:hypothetical protein n=1 Tax=Psychrobacter submarinus TaxID=154108 RepID=UPI00191A0DA2|nr:hypothetical protein [Psychrobacter submarinus]
MKYQLDESHENDIPCTALYKPNMDCFSPSIIVCFIMNDDWNEQMLRELKEKTGAYLLVGLQTVDSQFEVLNIIDGVINCRPDEVNDVIALLDVKAASTLIGIDVVDVKRLFECGNSFQFVQASATGEPEFDMIKVVTYNLISLLAKASDTKGVLVGMQSMQALPLESIAYVTEAVEGLLSGDEASIYCSSSSTDEFNTFGLKAIYAEE